MLDKQHSEKLVEAICFFVTRTRHCGFVKLFKLLYWFDYHHFRETGETVTGLTYNALPMGPVPLALYEELKGRSGDIVRHFAIKAHGEVIDDGPVRTIDDGDESPKFLRAGHRPAKWASTSIVPLTPYQAKYLTRREQRIATRLVEIFDEATADQISDVSHARGGPWQQTLRTKGRNQPIDFLGKLFPVAAGNYLDEEQLRERVADLEAEARNLL